MIKFILDTNVFVSGIFWSGPPYKILEAWQTKKLKLIISQDILDEHTHRESFLGFYSVEIFCQKRTFNRRP